MVLLYDVTNDIIIEVNSFEFKVGPTSVRSNRIGNDPYGELVLNLSGDNMKWANDFVKHTSEGIRSSSSGVNTKRHLYLHDHLSTDTNKSSFKKIYGKSCYGSYINSCSIYPDHIIVCISVDSYVMDFKDVFAPYFRDKKIDICLQ